MRSTAVRANQKTTCTIIFKNKEHENFIKSTCQNAGIRMCTIKHWSIALELTVTPEIM